MASNKVTNNSQTAEIWHPLPQRILKKGGGGFFLLGVAVNHRNTGLCLINSLLLPHCHCSDFLLPVMFWYTCWGKCSFFFFLNNFVFVFFCRQGICHLQFLYVNYLFICHHVAYFQIGDFLFFFFCLIYWFHCTNVLFCCFVSSYFLRFITSADTWLFFFLYFFFKCVNMLPHIPLYLRLPAACLRQQLFFFF